MNAEPPRGFVPARIVRRDDHAPDLATFWLAPDVPVPFRPGQYVTLAVRRPDGSFVRRAYSVASAPHEPEIELFVECVEHGDLTPCLFRLADGDTVWVRARAAGRFLLDPARSRHVMVATVTGVAPFRAMLRDHARALLAGETRDDRFLVLYGASHAPELGPYADELAKLAADGWLTVVPTVSRPWASPGWTGETGRAEEVLRKHLDARSWDPADVAGYACGNPDMVAAVPGLLKRAGVDPKHVHEEVYYTTTGDAVPIAGQAEDDAPVTPKPPPARPPGPPGGIVLKSVPREAR